MLSGFLFVRSGATTIGFSMVIGFALAFAVTMYTWLYAPLEPEHL